MLQINNLHTTAADKATLKGLSPCVSQAATWQQLPMAFAVEAQKLLGISLEGSVG